MLAAVYERACHDGNSGVEVFLPGARTVERTGEQYEAVKDRYRVVFECDDDRPTQIRASVTRQPAVGVNVFPGRRAEL